MATRRPDDAIRLVGVRQHNLKGFDVAFPKGALTVVTGISGSGKSSLVMDTLYAEGFRRYTEAMSPYVRRFLDQQRKPDVEQVHGIQPAVAFGQRNRARGARSTVGTATELVDLLRVLFARAGTLVCPDCARPAAAYTPETAAAAVLAEWPSGGPFLVLARLDLPAGAARGEVVAGLVRDGFGRYLAGAEVSRLDPSHPPRSKGLDVVVDRVTGASTASGATAASARLAEAIDQAYTIASDRASVQGPDGRRLELARALLCAGCGRRFAPVEPHALSFNSPLGACPACHGFGRQAVVDLARVVPDQSLSLAEGAVAPFRSPAYQECQRDLLKACRAARVPTNVPWRDLSLAARRFVEAGEGEWYGVNGLFEYLEKKRYKMHVRVLISRYRSFTTCAACGGARLKPEASWVRVAGRTLPDLCALPVEELQAFLYGLQLAPREAELARALLRDLRRRVDYLVRVGLAYLSLDRQTRTLSGGEAQRINLASALGADLNDTLYVLDEPSVGLHPADLDRLVDILQALRANRNTVVVVEHEPRLIAGADHVVDLGPGAGRLGGELLFAGPPADLARQDSATGRAMASRAAGGGAGAPVRRRKPSGWLTVRNARENNLKGIDVRVPLGVLACVTGVSGSGKSTLLERVLHAGVLRARGEPADEVGAFDSLEGVEQVASVQLIDQSPVARSGRSNPATFLKIFDPIRAVLAATPGARARGRAAGFFSANVPGGRCETCQGEGTLEVDLQFLGEAEIPCEACQGARFGPEALEIRYRGKNVVELLDLTVDEALAFFEDAPAVVRRLQLLAEMGLGYLRLGQPMSTLSAGESQRLKLARHLTGEERAAGALLLLDEPTTGLHPADIEVLLGVLARLVAEGASLVVVEHNLDLLCRADWLLDLGPGGGEAGGRVVAHGTPEQIARDPSSRTGGYLREALTGRS